MKHFLEALALHLYKALLFSVLTGVTLLPFGASAQLPPKLRLIVPFPPSGTIDFAARVLAESMRAQSGIPVIVENRPGGNGAVAALAVKQAAPDGETLFFTSSGTLTINPHLYSNLPYDVEGDFVPVTTVSYSQAALVVGASVPARNLKEFVEFARNARPLLAIGSGGTGNITHLYIELFKDAAKIDLLHVPYKGTVPAFTEVLSGQITGTFTTFNVALPQIRAGKVKALGITGTKRTPLVPDVPTFEEEGYTGIDFISWTGIIVRRGTRPEIVNAIANLVSSALAPEAAKAKMFSGDATVFLLPAKEFARVIKSDSDRWKKLISAKNIRAE